MAVESLAAVLKNGGEEKIEEVLELQAAWTDSGLKTTGVDLHHLSLRGLRVQAGGTPGRRCGVPAFVEADRLQAGGLPCIDRSAVTVGREGKTFCFRSEDCARTFASDPAAYDGAPAGMAAHPH